MPIAVAGKVTALLTGLTSSQIGAMSPADRQQLANECERVLRLAQSGGKAAGPRSGVLSELRRRHRGE